MLTQLSQTTTADGDKVTLYQTDEAFGSAYGSPDPQPFDGHRRRYVFSVEGKGASGFGAVGAGVEWVDGGSGRRETDAWEPGAVHVLSPWADCDTFGDAEDYQPVTIRGAVYGYGYAWKPAHPSSGQVWRIEHAGLTRQNGEITDAGRRRVSQILTAARDLYLALPDMERENVRRSLLGAQSRQDDIADKALKASKALDRKMAQLSGRPWAVDS
jgi:hypothetical protein